MTVAYYSTPSGNTRRFVARLGVDAHAIAPKADTVMDAPFVLVCPTYNGRVPAPVVAFLNQPSNRQWLRGVVGGGSRNFGADFARAARTVSHRCGVPLLHVFELSGLPEDVAIVRAGLETN
jgi:protein involved in ribonucleotide reduction